MGKKGDAIPDSVLKRHQELKEKGTINQFDYEQKITLGTPTFTHFRDSDYEDLVGLTERTPALGFKLNSNTYVFNYTLDFTSDAESDVSGADMQDFEGSDLPLFGKNYYISDFKNGSTSNYFGKVTLLDSSSTGTVSEGETVTKTLGTNSYDVSIAFISSTQVKFTVNGQTTNTLAKGETYKLSDGTYIGAKDITKLEVSGEVGSADFSLGTGKLEITSASDIKLNDNAINGLKGYMHKGSTTTTTAKIDKIVLEWKTDAESFVTVDSELIIPGFKDIKFDMGKLVRQDEEKITIEKDGDRSIQITMPIKEGDVNFNLLYTNASGEFIGIGKDADEKLATTQPGDGVITFYEKNSSGSNFHEWLPVSYNISSEAESYLLRCLVTTDGTSNITDIQKKKGGEWETACNDKKSGDTCDVGLVSLTVTQVNYTSGGEELCVLTAGSDVNFQTIFTPGGLKFYMPFGENTTGGEAPHAPDIPGALNFSDAGAIANNGFSTLTWYLFFDEEDKDDNIAVGVRMNLTIDDTTGSNSPLQVSQIAHAGSGGPSGLESGETAVYERYVVSDVATRTLHYTNPDEDYAEIYYPSGDSQTWGEVYLMDVDANVDAGSSDETTTTTSGGSTTVGVAITDSEVSSASGKNLIVVGGSCVNSVAASLIGSSSALCGADWTAVTNVGSGEFLIETFDQNDGTVATLIGGYDAGDTQNAATFLTTQEAVDTTASSKYIGTTSTSAEMVTSTGGGDDAGDSAT